MGRQQDTPGDGFIEKVERFLPICLSNISCVCKSNPANGTRHEGQISCEQSTDIQKSEGMIAAAVQSQRDTACSTVKDPIGGRGGQ